LVRSSVDVLLATGIVRETAEDNLIAVRCDSEQDLALRMCGAMTSGCVRLKSEISAINEEMRELSDR
jgi:hypothetical protein